MPLSIIGTFAAMYLLGYSLNNLTLMALTISTGFVVDDAIVMIENIIRYVEKGEKPLEAALKGDREQIGFTMISLSVSLIAVLIPLLFMQDVVGRLFREFAITLSVTIVVSAVVSLTLTPMMCAYLLKHKRPEDEGRFYKVSEKAFEWIIARYAAILRVVLRHQFETLIVAAATLVLTAVLFTYIPKGFFPVQDTGVIQGISVGPENTSFDQMSDRQQALADEILKDPDVDSLSSFIGIDGTNITLNSGRIQINLKEWRRTWICPALASVGGARRGEELDAVCGGAADAGGRHYSEAVGQAGIGAGHHAVHAAGAGFDGRGSGERDAISVHAGEPRPDGAGVLDEPVHREAQGNAGFDGCGERPAERGVAGETGDRPRDGIAAECYAADDRRCTV